MSLVTPAGTTNPGVNWKTNNLLIGIWNPVPRKPDNPLKGVHDIVLNITQNQCLIGLNVQPIYIYNFPINRYYHHALWHRFYYS